jgi:hypothetical protein
MTGEDLKVVADQDRVGKAKGFDTLGDLFDLCARVPPKPFSVQG